MAAGLSCLGLVMNVLLTFQMHITIPNFFGLELAVGPGILQTPAIAM